MSGKKDKINYSESSNYILLISFLEGAAVMGVEIIGAKMIAPYFGSSLYSWSAVLAVTLMGLTSGYYFGGIVSEKYPNPKTLYIILAISVLFTAIMPITGPSVMNSMLEVDFRLASVLSSLVFILPPLFCFGMVSPLIIRRLTTDLDSSGRKAGLVYAISTVGGIICTFITGFYLIPEFGLRLSSILISLFLLPFPVRFFLQSKLSVGFVFFLMGFLLISFVNVSKAFVVKSNSGILTVPYQSEGLLGTITVVDYPQKFTRCLFVNNIAQSYIHIPSQRSQWKYIHRLATYTAYKPEKSKVLVCGLGAGNVVNEMLTLNFDVTVVDIESRMEKVAKEFFFLKEGYKFIVDDARHAIKSMDEKFDIVILDVSAGENQPLNLYTKEGFEDVKRILKEDGVLFIHFPSMIGGEESTVFKSILKTLDYAELNPQFLNTFHEGVVRYDFINEQIIVASLKKVELGNLDFSRRDAFSVPFNFPLSGDNLIVKDYDFSQGIVLTDDLPILELLHEKMISNVRQNGMSESVRNLLNNGYEII